MKHMTIPTSMQVGEHKYGIHTVKYMPRKGAMGVTYYGNKCISVATHSNKSRTQFAPPDFNETFWHELTHAVLFEMGSTLYKDEVFVTRFAEHLSRAIDTAEFK
jgi:predicted SprT family Zn-dependent metalloprotease